MGNQLIFQHCSAPAHRACTTIDTLCHQTPDFNYSNYNYNSGVTLFQIYLTLDFFYFVPSAEYVYIYRLCCIMLRMSVDFYQHIPR